MAGHRVLVPLDYHGIRLFLTASGVTLAAVALTRTVLTRPLVPLLERLGRTRGANNVLVGIGCLTTAIVLVVPLPGSVRVAWMQSTNAPLYRAVSRVRGMIEPSANVMVPKNGYHPPFVR
jgi:ABC-type sulfate transport system permease subunit